MKIAIGADHAGFELKQKIRDHLQSQGFEVLDEGTNSPDSVDYPDYALKVSEDVTGQRADLGIRAARVTSETDAQLSREHNDANVLTLGARVTASDLAQRIVDVWLKTPFLAGRHARRVEKISEFEKAEAVAASTLNPG